MITAVDRTVLAALVDIITAAAADIAATTGTNTSTISINPTTTNPTNTNPTNAVVEARLCLLTITHPMPQAANTGANITLIKAGAMDGLVLSTIGREVDYAD
jgi:hypothetical protein